MGFFIGLMALVMIGHSYVDYLNYGYLKHPSRLRTLWRNGLLRLWGLSFTIWFYLNSHVFATTTALVMPLGVMMMGSIAIGLSTRRWTMRNLPGYVWLELKDFLKFAFSLIIVALVLVGVFETRLFSSLWQVMFFSLTALALIYLMIYSVILPRIFRFIPYRMREEKSGLFLRYPRINHTVYMAQSNKLRLPMNALFMAGIKKLRVVLSDRLLARLSSSEIKGIVAHELGHGAKHHLWVRALAMVGMIGFYLVLGQLVFETDYLRQSFTQFALGESLFVLMVLLYSTENIAVVLLYQLTQYQEFQSDRYAVELGYGLALAEALEKIHRYQPDPQEHPLAKKLGLSHPDTLLRVRKLKEAAVK